MRFETHEVLSFISVFDYGSEIGLILELLLHFVLFFLVGDVGFNLGFGVPELFYFEFVFVPEVVFEAVDVDFDGVLYLTNLLFFPLLRHHYFHSSWQIFRQFEAKR